jgi:hypothetical protein
MLPAELASRVHLSLTISEYWDLILDGEVYAGWR